MHVHIYTKWGIITPHHRVGVLTAVQKVNALTHIILPEGEKKEKTLLKDNKTYKFKTQKFIPSPADDDDDSAAVIFSLCMEQLKTRRMSFAATRIHTLQTCTCTHVIKHTHRDSCPFLEPPWEYGV